MRRHCPLRALRQLAIAVTASVRSGVLTFPAACSFSREGSITCIIASRARACLFDFMFVLRCVGVIAERVAELSATVLDHHALPVAARADLA